jgi:hypothetical protein
MRAEIRAGELLRAMAQRNERQSQSQPRKLKSPGATLNPPKLVAAIRKRGRRARPRSSPISA